MKKSLNIKYTKFIQDLINKNDLNKLEELAALETIQIPHKLNKKFPDFIYKYSKKSMSSGIIKKKVKDNIENLKKFIDQNYSNIKLNKKKYENIFLAVSYTIAKTAFHKENVRKIYGLKIKIKKNKSKETLEYDPKGVLKRSGADRAREYKLKDQQKAYNHLLFIMNRCIEAQPLGEALKNFQVENNLNCRRINTAFALGIVDFYGEVLELSEVEIIEVHRTYITRRFNDEKYEKGEGENLLKWTYRNYMNKNFLKVKKMGGDLSLSFYKKKFKKPLQLFNAIYENQNVFAKESKKKKLFGIF